MITYYKTISERLQQISDYEEYCWVNCVAPDDDEANVLMDKFGIPPEFIRASLDEEESSHIDIEDNSTLIIIDIPIVKRKDETVTYTTTPLGIMITQSNVITVSLHENSLIKEFSEGAVRGVNTKFKTHFVLLFMLRMAKKYLQYLKMIDKTTEHVQAQLRKNMKNQDLMRLMDAETSLVYFQSSLKANEITLQKITRGRVIKLYEDDQDLLDDVLIEIRQAVDMSSIYLNVLSGSMDAFASIISNNLNIVMKVLASLTLIISIPTVISGIYGMNMNFLPFQQYFWFPIVLSAVLMLLSYIILKKKGMF